MTRAPASIASLLFTIISIAQLFAGCNPPNPASGAGIHGQGSAPETPTLTVSISDRLIQFDEEQVPFPATIPQLTAAIGPPDRDLGEQNHNLIWDHKGFRAYCKIDPEVTRDIMIFFVTKEPSHPQTTFDGTVKVGDVTITSQTTVADLRSNGFSEFGDHTGCIKDLGATSVIVTGDGRISCLIVTNSQPR
jgi:hypothetical protein